MNGGGVLVDVLRWSCNKVEVVSNGDLVVGPLVGKERRVRKKMVGLAGSLLLLEKKK